MSILAQSDLASKGVAGPRLDNDAISRRSRVPSGGAMMDLMPGACVISAPRPGVKPPDSVRGPIRGFSAKSRRRMMLRLAAIDWKSVVEPRKKSTFGKAFLLTLTYLDYPGGKIKSKRDLGAFRKRLERNLPALSGFWKQELQERGVPHFHITIFFKNKVAWQLVRNVVFTAWNEITGAKVIDVQTVWARDGDAARLMRYMSKYMAKKWESDDEWGRVWGCWNPEELPTGPTYEIELTRDAYVEFCRRVRRWGRKSPFLRMQHIGRGGFMIYGSQEKLVQLLRGLDLVL